MTSHESSISGLEWPCDQINGQLLEMTSTHTHTHNIDYRCLSSIFIPPYPRSLFYVILSLTLIKFVAFIWHNLGLNRDELMPSWMREGRKRDEGSEQGAVSYIRRKCIKIIMFHEYINLSTLTGEACLFRGKVLFIFDICHFFYAFIHVPDLKYHQSDTKIYL